MYDHYAAQLRNAERRRALAEELAARSSQPLRSQVAPGGVMVPIGWGEVAANLGQAWMARRAGKKADEEETRALTERSAAVTEGIDDFYNATPDENVGREALVRIMSSREGELMRPVSSKSAAQRNLMALLMPPEQHARTLVEQSLAPAKVEHVDLGNRIGLVRGGQLISEIPKGASPDAAANRAAADARAAEQRAFTERQGQLTRDQQRALAEEQRALTQRGQDFTQERATVDDARLQAEADRKVAAEQRERADRYQGALNSFEQGMQLLDRIETHPGLGAAVGAKGFSSLFGLLGEPVAGTDAADFTALVNQLGGRQFLEAFENLRGGGQISNVEGQKAEQAIMNLSRSQSEKQFRENIGILRDIMGGTLARARLRAGNAESAAAPPAMGAPGDLSSLSDADILRNLGL